MAGRSPTLTKNFKAEAAVPRHRIVKLGAADSGVTLGAASTDLLLGVSTEIDTEADEPCDVHLDGVVDVEFGGNVTRLAWLTSDEDGRAIVAAPAAGVNASVIGRALVAGVAGDIGVAHLAPGRIQG